MSYYSVNATMTLAAWVNVEADSEEEAFAEAQQRDPSEFEYDIHTAEVEFNVTPAVEVS